MEVDATYYEHGFEGVIFRIPCRLTLPNEQSSGRGTEVPDRTARKASTPADVLRQSEETVASLVDEHRAC